MSASKWDRSLLGEDEDRDGESHLHVSGYRSTGVLEGGFIWGEVYQEGRPMGFITRDHTGKVKSPRGAGSHPISRPSARGKKREGAQRDKVWEAVEEETAQIALPRPSSTSGGFTDSSSKAATSQAGSWSLQKVNGPKN